jgi:hypothetical protein
MRALFRAGDQAALFRAMKEVWRHHPEPNLIRWMIDAAAEVLERRMSDQERQQRKDWYRHKVRHELVVELRSRRAEFKERGDERGATLDRTWQDVSDVLQGDVAWGSESTIRASYFLVQKLGGDAATFADYLKYLKNLKGA